MISQTYCDGIKNMDRNCEYFRNQALLCLCGEAEEGVKDVLDSHLVSCRECSDYYAELSDSMGLPGLIADPPEIPPIETFIKEPQTSGRIYRKKPFTFRTVAAIAGKAAILVIALLALFAYNSGVKPEQPEMPALSDASFRGDASDDRISVIHEEVSGMLAVNEYETSEQEVRPASVDGRLSAMEYAFYSIYLNEDSDDVFEHRILLLEEELFMLDYDITDDIF